MSEYSPAQEGEIRADVEALYYAGKKTIPQLAQNIADQAADMSSVIESVNARSSDMGDHPVTKDVLNLAVDCQHGVNRAVITLNNLAAGVIAIADDFVGRDDFARSVFDGIREELGLTPELGDAENSPVDAPGATSRDHILADGSPEGPRVSENPDAQDPEDELEDRNEDVRDDQGDIDIPDVS